METKKKRLKVRLFVRSILSVSKRRYRAIQKDTPATARSNRKAKINPSGLSLPSTLGINIRRTGCGLYD